MTGGRRHEPQRHAKGVLVAGPRPLCIVKGPVRFPAADPPPAAPHGVATYLGGAPPRVGGMAFGNGVLMRSQRWWAWARDDGSVVDGPVLTVLDRHSLLRLPVVRSAVVFVEMIAMAIRLHRRNGLRPAAALLAWLGLAMVASVALSALVPDVVPGEVAGYVVVQVLSFALALLALRQGMGKTVWRYHGAEHKAVNAYEAGADLSDAEVVMTYSRIHDRCGTNLVAIIFLLMLGSLLLGDQGALLSAVYAVLAVAVSLEFFRLIVRWPRSLASRVCLSGGKALQRCLTTREPAYEHLDLACAALRRVLELDRRAGFGVGR